MSELGARVDAANREAVGRMLEASPAWVGVVRARHAVRGLGEREVCLAGPPITWREATSPQRQAVVEAALFEGWASSEADAEALAAGGGIALASAHDRGGVAPPGLAVSPSTPVLSIEDRATALRTWSAVDASGVAGAARALETGAERASRRAFVRDVLGPALDRAVDVAGSIDLLAVLGRALHQGDELAVRVEAAQSLLTTELSRHLVRAGIPRGELGLVLDHLATDAALFAAIASGAAKAIAEAASSVPTSSVVTAMAQGGRRFGIRVSGLGGRWFTADLGAAALLEEDLGDRPIAECAGLGAFALPAAPAVLAAYAGARADIPERVLAMRSITLAAHPRLTVPALGFEGVRVGIDLRRVVETGLEPVLAAALGASGPRSAPLACFLSALEAFADAVGAGEPTP